MSFSTASLIYATCEVQSALSMTLASQSDQRNLFHGAELLAKKGEVGVPHGPFLDRLLTLAIARKNARGRVRSACAIGCALNTDT
ncbi:MAG TPA: hypothetical protein VHZ07_05045 [Bryobacteraceae bacterium]|nr:hypothetical protein [Bryobacteraceae bacterium]